MASGYQVFDGAIAMGQGYPLGTIVKIPEVGWAIALDRGGVVHDGIIDVYMKDLGEARSWGRKSLEVEVYPMKDGDSLEERVEFVKNKNNS